MMKRTMTTAAVAAGAAVTLVAGAPMAAAGTSVGVDAYTSTACPGSQIDSGRLRDSYNTVHPTAVWRLYYSAGNGGTNCLTVYDNKSGAHYMAAVVQETGRQIHYASDFGTYDYYAGAVAVTRMSGKCLDWVARIDDFGKSYAAHQYVSHCG